MQCGSCTEEIPSDSIFCPECGSRQELSRAGEIPGVGGVGLAGQAVSGGRNFGVNGAWLRASSNSSDI